MADFCKDCSLKIFGEDFGDLAGIVEPGDVLYSICEGCDATMFDHTGARFIPENPSTTDNKEPDYEDPGTKNPQ